MHALASPAPPGLSGGGGGGHAAAAHVAMPSGSARLPLAPRGAPAYSPAPMVPMRMPRLQRRAPLLPAPAAAKDAAPAIVNYTVQKGETLWDVAVMHGVSMRTIKEMNKLPGREPVLVEGQQLLVPASGLTQLAEGSETSPAVTLGTAAARGLWVGSEHVRLATIAEAKQLYLAQCERGNSQHTLLVLFAPWCPHCRNLEDELERLAEGLSHVPSVRVVAVNADSTEGRVFSREVLGVSYYPSIIAFPMHSRTFYKYKGRQRDAESLLRFLNMTCCAAEEQMWTLRPAGTRGVMAGGVAGPLERLGLPLPLGTSPAAAATMAAVGVLALGAGVWAVAVARGRGAAAPADAVAELDSSLGRMALLMWRALQARVALMLGLGLPVAAPAAAAAAAAAAATAEPVAPATPAPVAASEPAAAASEPAAAATVAEVPAAASASSTSPSPSDVAAVTALDSTRVPPEAALPAAPAQALASPAPPPSVNGHANGHANGNGNGNGSAVAAAPAAAAVPVTATVVAAATVVTAASPVASPVASTDGAAATATATAVAAAPAATALAVPPARTTRELTAEERLRLTRLTDDELIALVNSDPDLDKVLSRLLGDKV